MKYIEYTYTTHATEWLNINTNLFPQLSDHFHATALGQDWASNLIKIFIEYEAKKSERIIDHLILRVKFSKYKDCEFPLPIN